MANLYLSGTAPRGSTDRQPVSVVELFGGKPVPGCWSGLYGSASTREGLKRLIQGAAEPSSVFRVICSVPGGLSTSVKREDIATYGYFNIRYAQAALHHDLARAWTEVTGCPDGVQAMREHPEAVVEALKQAGIPPIAVVIHPFEIPQDNLLLYVATVLDEGAIVECHSRDKTLSLHFPGMKSACS